MERPVARVDTPEEMFSVRHHASPCTVEGEPTTPGPHEDPGVQAPRAGQVLIVVPAFNEEASIAGTLAQIREHCPWADAVVIDDGSRDGTAREAAPFGFPVVRLPFNLGIGGAVQTGFLFALGKGYAAVVQVDGDGQHPPGAIAQVAAPVLAGTADVVVGSRFLPGGAYDQGFARALGGRILSRLVSAALRRRLVDTTSGFRAYSAAVVRHLAEDYPYDYPEPEVLVSLGRCGFRIAEIPVSMHPRRDGVSSIGLGVSVKYMMKVPLAILLTLLRPRGARA